MASGVYERRGRGHIKGFTKRRNKYLKEINDRRKKDGIKRCFVSKVYGFFCIKCKKQCFEFEESSDKGICEYCYEVKGLRLPRTPEQKKEESKIRAEKKKMVKEEMDNIVKEMKEVNEENTKKRYLL